jgi:hypothetical protein
MISMSRPGKRALALVASISLSRLYVRSGMGLYHFHAPTPSRWAPTCRDRLANYRSSVPVLKARRLAATTMAARRGRTDPRLLEARMAFHLHRLMPVGRELCRPHRVAFPLLHPKNGHGQAAPARPKSADTVEKVSFGDGKIIPPASSARAPRTASSARHSGPHGNRRPRRSRF